MSRVFYNKSYGYHRQQPENNYTSRYTATARSYSSYRATVQRQRAPVDGPRSQNPDFPKLVNAAFQDLRLTHHMENWRALPTNLRKQVANFYSNIIPPLPDKDLNENLINAQLHTINNLKAIVQSHLNKKRDEIRLNTAKLNLTDLPWALEIATKRIKRNFKHVPHNLLDKELEIFKSALNDYQSRQSPAPICLNNKTSTVSTNTQEPHSITSLTPNPKKRAGSPLTLGDFISPNPFEILNRVSDCDADQESEAEGSDPTHPKVMDQAPPRNLSNSAMKLKKSKKSKLSSPPKFILSSQLRDTLSDPQPNPPTDSLTASGSVKQCLNNNIVAPLNDSVIITSDSDDNTNKTTHRKLFTFKDIIVGTPTTSQESALLNSQTMGNPSAIVHDNRKDSWVCKPSNSTKFLIIGDSNMKNARPPPDFEIHAFKGATLYHGRAILFDLLRSANNFPNLQAIILAFGINNRDTNLDTSLYHLNQILFTSTGDYCAGVQKIQIFFSGIAFADSLNATQKANLEQINNEARKSFKGNFIPQLEPSLVKIAPKDPYGIHYDKITLDRILNRMYSFLELSINPPVGH